MRLDAWPVSETVEDVDIGKERRHQVMVLERIENLTPAMAKKFFDCARERFKTSLEKNRSALRGILINGGRIYYVLDSRGHVLGSAASQKDVYSPFDPEGPNNPAGLWFSAGAVRKGERGSGVYAELNRSRIQPAIDQRLAYVALDTDNPKVELGLRRAFQEYKNEEGGSVADFMLLFQKNSGIGDNSREKPEKCGIQEIDDRFATLEKGQAFTIRILVTYRK